jgi:hypothetical protein
VTAAMAPVQAMRRIFCCVAAADIVFVSSLVPLRDHLKESTTVRSWIRGRNGGLFNRSSRSVVCQGLRLPGSAMQIPAS